MIKSLTLEEVIPQVITDLKDLQQAIRDGKINTYQTNLVLTSILYSLEHPEKHFSDGSVAIQ